MLDLLFQGGPLFMGILTIILFSLIFYAIRLFMSLSKVDAPKDIFNNKLATVKSIGICALIIGVLGQLIGLYSGFSAMEGMENGISTAMLAGGLRVSTIPVIYGLIICTISYLLWFVLRWKSNGG